MFVKDKALFTAKNMDLLEGSWTNKYSGSCSYLNFLAWQL